MCFPGGRLVEKPATASWHVVEKDGSGGWHSWPSPWMALLEAEARGYIATGGEIDLHGDGGIVLVLPDAENEPVSGGKWARAKPCYLRFGALPKNRKSRNHRDDIEEAGVSVFRGLLSPDNEAAIVVASNFETGSAVSCLRDNRDAFVVTGEETGFGSDGEPVLENVRILHKALVTEVLMRTRQG